MILEKPYRVRLSNHFLVKLFGDSHITEGYHLGQKRGTVLAVWQNLAFVVWDNDVKLPSWQSNINLERVGR